MPELPEVEIVKQGIEQAVLGRRVSHVDQRRPDLRIPFPENLVERLQGCKIAALSRRGKYVWVHLESDHEASPLIMVLHLGMSGRVLIIPPGDSYELDKHDHLVLKMDDSTLLIFQDPRRFGMVMLMAESEIERHKSFAHMGPEPLGNEFHKDAFQEKLASKSAAIKTVLLDQRVVAGIGNIYASEALFYASIHPERSANSLSDEEAENLCHAVKDVLRKAIRAGGSTLKDYRHADGELGYFQHSFAVYDKEGEVCTKCSHNGPKKASIEKIVQAGRSTFFCAACQK